jgi:hypothetical protein
MSQIVDPDQAIDALTASPWVVERATDREAAVVAAVVVAGSRSVCPGPARQPSTREARERGTSLVGVDGDSPGPAAEVGELAHLAQRPALGGLQLGAHELDVPHDRQQTHVVLSIPRVSNRNGP